MIRRAGLIFMTVLAAVVALASPGTADPATAAPSTINVAHRGASAYAPENTVAAFRLAARQGADMFELDVQETSDHRLVLMHDTTLARTTDVERVFPGRAPWRVADFTLAEIRKLDAGSWFGDDAEPVPTLQEALQAMRGSGLGLLLEIKSPRLYPGIEARVARELRRSWSGGLAVQSFDWGSMRRFARTMPEAPIGLLGTPSAGELPALAEFADQINPPHGDVTRDYVESVHDLDMAVLTWTVDDAATMRRMIASGVDGIITNRPDVLREL
jgi:glycerophosphoryl diester phosphodiesterase